MEYKKFGSMYVMRLDRYDEVMESLMQFVKETGTTLASIVGLGAADEVNIGLYNVEEQKYHETILKEPFEITNLTGNITTMNHTPYLHVHITLAKEDGSAVGGHLKKAVICGTGELFIQTIDGTVDRKVDEKGKTGLNVFDFR